MNKELEDRIRQAVEKGREARHAYYNAIHLPDEQDWGLPTPENQIVDIETWLKKRLPPAYRTFLSLYGGWRMAYGAVASLFAYLLGSIFNPVLMLFLNFTRKLYLS